MIVGLIGYDSIRKHLAACGYYTAEIREKYYLRIADAYIDIKEQRGQYWLENIMKDRFAVSMFGQKRLSREGGIEIVVKELCTRMARDGCQVTCYNRSGHHVSGGAYAPIMVKCMNKYLSDKSYKAVEISGKSLEYLSGKYVAQGQPIMVWATINMSPSFKTTTWRVNYTDENAKYKLGSYYTWTAGEHCLLLTGYDKDYYYFNDPWTNARTRYSKSLVNTRYNELGKQAVVMVKK